MVLDVVRAKKIRVMAVRYGEALEKNAVLLARIDNKDEEIAVLRKVNGESKNTISGLNRMVKNRENLIIIKNDEIKKIKTHRLILGVLFVISLVI